MGETSFFELPLLTAPGKVMTPRPASEQLVASALERIGDRPTRVVDVGTGSGAIAIALASAALGAEVWATDRSRCAVALARANVRRHGLGDRITVRHGDLIEPVPDPIDLVVANLPYLPLGEAARYPELGDEPATAVFAPADGLGPYRRLFAACRDRLDDDADVVIQLHRAVLAVKASELPVLEARIAHRAARANLRPRLAAA